MHEIGERVACHRFDRRQFLLGAGRAACVAPLSWSPQEVDFADLATKISAWRREKYVAAADVAVIRAGKPVWTRGFGIKNQAMKAVVDHEIVVLAASLSKAVFAYAVLAFVAEGKFDLDKPLTEYVTKPFRSRMKGLMASEVVDDPRLNRITVRIALSHTTGFPNWGRGKLLVPQADPGQKFGYSGEGYVYLQNEVEDVSGEPLDGFARKRVLVSLSMTSSSFLWREDYDIRAAIGYTR